MPLSIEYAYFPLLDDGGDNVLLHVDKCHDTIARHIEKGHNILVHCQEGVSRSVALVTGYLMKRGMAEFEPMYAFLLKEYPQARIASNFAAQLTDYGSVFHWDMHRDTQVHRLYRAQHRLGHGRREQVTPKYVYTCRKCRKLLFIDAQVIPSINDNYPVECMVWMTGVDSANNGPLSCPKCACKLGEFNWSGLLGHVPGFIITKSKVDQMPVRSPPFPESRF